MSRARELADLSNVINKGANLQPNLAFNGDMSVWQRGTSDDTATAGDYMCDRWRINHTGTDGNVDWDQETASTPDGFGYALKVSMDASETSLDAGDFVMVHQRFEGQNLQHLDKGSANAKKLTLSFWVKSSVASTYTVSFRDTDNSRLIGKSYTINIADTWEFKTIIFEGDTTGSLVNDNNTSLDLQYWLDAGSDWTSGTFSTDWIAQDNTRRVYDTTGWLESTSPEFYITGVSLVVGDSAPVTHPYESYAENLERCRRYYEVTADASVSAPVVIGSGMWYNSSNAYVTISYSNKRTDPTITAPTVTSGYRFYYGNNYKTVTSIAFQRQKPDSARVSAASSGATQGDGSWGEMAAAGAKIEIDAEL